MQCTIKLIHINSITLQIVNTMLQIENLEFSYHKKGNPIFNGINLTIQPGSPEVTKQTSLWVSTGWVQLSAFAVCVLAWLFTGRESVAALWQVDNKYTLLGGVVGAFITITVIQSMGALGPAKAAMLIVISQLVVAYVIELAGLFGVDKEPFEWRKILGLLIAIFGIIIFKWQK